MATERSLERCGIDSFDLLLLHNPDRIGYTSEAVWSGMASLREAGLTRMIGVAPGPANGFTLDLIDCIERFGALIDWAMIILNPLEPWPGELCLAAAAAADVKVITRVVDYGGLFFDDVVPGQELLRHDHRSFRPAGWIEAGRERLERMRPIADRAGLTMIQLACQWNLAHDPVACVVPTLIQEAGPGARPVERKREELAALPESSSPHRRRRRRDPLDRRQHRIAWRSRAQAPSTPATSERTAGRSIRASRTWPAAGASSPIAISRGVRGRERSAVGGARELSADRRLRLRRRALRVDRAARLGKLLPLHALSASHRSRRVGQRARGARLVHDPRTVRSSFAPGDPKAGSRNGSAATAARPCSAAIRQITAHVGVRLGTLDSDPGIRPGWHQFIAYAASWEPIPQDGLPRYEETRPAGA